MSFEWLMVYVLPFLGILTVVVFFHELGHYLLARYNGVKVEVFSIGFGPELFGFNDSHGTRWKFSLLPLGGYVKMFSDLNPASQPDLEKSAKMTEEEKAVSLMHKTVWQRIQVSAAGPIANFVFAIIVLSFIYTISGQRVPTEDAVVGAIAPGSAAEVAGLKTGDIITTFNGTPIKLFQELIKGVVENPGKEFEIDVTRGEDRLKIKITPTTVVEKDKDGNSIEVGRIGISSGVLTIKRSPVQAVFYASLDTYYVIARTLESLGQMIIGQRSTDGLSGPLGIAKVTGEVARGDLAMFFWFMAFLSINLGLINLFPVPVLDGGHLLFYFIEAIRGKPLSEKTQEIGFSIGFALILVLMLFSTWNDLVRLEVVQYMRNLIGF